MVIMVVPPANIDVICFLHSSSVLTCKSQHLAGDFCTIQWVGICVKIEGFLAQGKFHESSSYLRSQSCLKKRFKINVSKPKAFYGMVRHQIDPLNCTEISR